MTNGEDDDAISRDEAGNLLLSTVSRARATNLDASDEDLFRFSPTQLGSVTSGSFLNRFDGSDVGLGGNNNEDVTAAHYDAATTIFLSTRGPLSANGASGGDEDVARFSGSLGSATSGSFTIWFDGSAVGLPGNWDIRGLCIR